MAEVQAAFGVIKGKIGNLRFAEWNGINVVAQQPSGYTDANVPAQQANRGKLAAISQLGRQFLAALQVGFEQFSDRTTYWAEFVRVNIDVFTAANGTPVFTNPQALRVSVGNLPGFVSLAKGASTATSQVLTWTNNSAAFGANPTDRVCVVAVDATGKIGAAVVTTATRATGTVTITLPAAIIPGTAKYYVFLLTASGAMESSDSTYI